MKIKGISPDSFQAITQLERVEMKRKTELKPVSQLDDQPEQGLNQKDQNVDPTHIVLDLIKKRREKQAKNQDQYKLHKGKQLYKKNSQYSQYKDDDKTGSNINLKG